jgi:hypothetical protein
MPTTPTTPITTPPKVIKDTPPKRPFPATSDVENKKTKLTFTTSNSEIPVDPSKYRTVLTFDTNEIKQVENNSTPTDTQQHQQDSGTNNPVNSSLSTASSRSNSPEPHQTNVDDTLNSDRSTASSRFSSPEPPSTSELHS